MYTALLIKYAEIGLKGSNRRLFENALMQQMRYALKRENISYSLRSTRGRIYVENLSPDNIDIACRSLQYVFGISGICPVIVLDDDGVEMLKPMVAEYIEREYKAKPTTFKVAARRARKNYSLDSMGINVYMGEYLLNRFDWLSVDIHEPQIILNIEIREKIYIYSKTIDGLGGIPTGTGGKAMLLLSGGIDSPVAGYMIGKRGVKLDATYFHAPPYTSERAKQKVIDLARILSRYVGPIYLNIINFTDIQMNIYEKCPKDELTIIMRRYMMKIAEDIACKTESLGLITGESIGQVASQTMHSLMATNAVCTLPVYRPLIGMDKQEIIAISEKIGSYETSILPYEDCCTIFVAKHPVIKPKLKYIERHERYLEDVIDELIDKAIHEREVMVVRPDDV